MTSIELGDSVVLEPRGDLFAGPTCDDMERSLLALAERGRRVVVDLSEAHQLSARGLGILAHAQSVAARRGGRIVLCGANRVQRWLLSRTGLIDVFELYPTRASAIHEHFGGGLSPSRAAARP